jgi:beta-lactamase superfamily II metal-dependent hydrolase
MKTSVYIVLALFLLTLPLSAFGKCNGSGNLQLHFIDVGQADGILLISPKGETVLWDGGRPGLCERAIAYMDQLGVRSLEYLITTHYDNDHIGCTKDILNKFPVEIAACDRDGTFKKGKYYNKYIDAVSDKRKAAEEGMTITLAREAQTRF